MLWRLRLVEFGFDFVFKKGAFNIQVDGPSYLPTTGETQATIHEDEITCFTVDGQVPEYLECPETGNFRTQWMHCVLQAILRIRYQGHLYQSLPRS